MSTTVKDVMTTEVVWVEKDTPFAAMAASLRQFRVSAFPVLSETGQVIGMVSEADMLTKEALGGGDDEMPGMITGILRLGEYRKARGVTAGEIMTAPAVTVSPHATVENAARLMYLHRVKRLPVVDADRRLVGIISQSDVLSVFDRTDDQIRENVMADVRAARLLPHPEVVQVAVRDGVVTLTGAAQSAETGHKIARRARHVEGVVAVRDRLTYPAAGPHGFDVVASFPAD
jgi:CBS domain-containing protein